MASAVRVNVASAAAAAASVFDVGPLNVVVTTKDRGAGDDAPPNSVLVVSPSDAGAYPVVLFLHGFFLWNSSYTQLLRHVASHGFIVVAPQLFNIIPSSPEEDIASAAAVTDWLPKGLKSVLPGGVRPDLPSLALAGHSRGGHTAFALALGHAETALKFSALVGVDLVAGQSRSSQVSPKILTYVPSSFDLDLPVLVVGTGLGSQRKSLHLPPCAPEGVNHEEFYDECRPPCYHFVAGEYGHMDMRDDEAAAVGQLACKSGERGTMEVMRRATGGLMVAFLKAWLEGQGGELDAIVDNPGLAPTTLHPTSARLKAVAEAAAARGGLMRRAIRSKL